MATIDSQTSGSVTPAPLARAPAILRIVLFYAITFTLSWALFLPLVLRAFSPQSGVGALLLALGVAGPTATAFVLTALTAGRDGVHRLWRQVTRWRAGVGWYALVLVGPGLVYAIGLAVAARLGFQAPAVNLGDPAVWIAVVVSGVLAGSFEEFGWSGVAFPTLQARYGFMWAGVVVGIALASWHLPFFFIPGLPHYSASFALFLLAGVPLRILFGWIYNGTGGSVLLMILFHASLNAWAEILSLPTAGAEPVWLSFTAILWVAAAAVLLMNRRAMPRSKSA
ncbi:MAG: type II CAAX prenyl endopeptidase Rce1 family protein [Roseiflexaceae bacterium]